MNRSNHWDLIISPQKKLFTLRLNELIYYRDLIFLFVKRDFITQYKQTILGPIWIVLQPLLTSFVLTIVFGYIAKIESGAPTILFMMAGVTVWNFFADCVTKTSETFIANQNLFGKVYFPRMVVPISIILTNQIKFFIQFGLFILFYFYFVIFVGLGSSIEFSPQILLLPFLILLMAGLGLGTGLIIASLTIKYRDLRFLIQFGIQLLMYASPVVYPLKVVPEKYQWILLANPMTSIIETFKYGFFGETVAIFSWLHLAYTSLITLFICLIGVWSFNRVEQSFMDTI
ncbi:MAG: ABC transporter permease [Crocinitomicaceae bacterium]|nr:ABC transporter permease [Crocinitomicaceae bacterium]